MIQEKVAEILNKNLHISGFIPNDTISGIDQAAAEIVALMEYTADSTLTKLAADLEIPLWKAMEVAKHQKEKDRKWFLDEVLPKMRVTRLGYSKQTEHEDDGFNECLAEIRRRLSDKAIGIGGKQYGTDYGFN